MVVIHTCVQNVLCSCVCCSIICVVHSTSACNTHTRCARSTLLNVIVCTQCAIHTNIWQQRKKQRRQRQRRQQSADQQLARLQRRQSALEANRTLFHLHKSPRKRGFVFLVEEGERKIFLRSLGASVKPFLC